MIDVEIITVEKTIKEKIKDWEELKELLLLYKNYICVKAHSIDEKESEISDEKRHAR